MTFYIKFIQNKHYLSQIFKYVSVEELKPYILSFSFDTRLILYFTKMNEIILYIFLNKCK